MRLTKRKALTICRELWTWLAENPSKRKHNWPGWKKYGDMTHECPCCEYVNSINYDYWLWLPDEENCASCPLGSFWPSVCESEEWISGLTGPRTAWERWFCAKTPRTRKKYALQIVKGCEDALAKLPKLKRRSK